MKKDEWIDRLRREIPEVSPEEAARGFDGAELVLLDVRESDEYRTARIAGAVHVARGYLELHAEKQVPDKETPIVAYCAGGVRSLFAAEALVQLGYRDVRSLRGGFRAWRSSGLPFEEPRVLGEAERQRYARQTVIPEIGEEGQSRLLDARVLLVGAGGLGSPAGLYLAAAGVGTLGIADFDVVEESNLQRQILHTTHSVGEPKVESARRTILALNPGVQVRTHPERLEAHNAPAIFEEYDIVVDGSDNFETRYLVNDLCVERGLPNVHGSIFRFDGQVTVFWSGNASGTSPNGPCYRCLYPSPPPPELAPS